MIPQSISRFCKDFFRRHPDLRRRKKDWASSCYSAAEVLEVRSMLSVTMAPLIANDLPNDKTEFIAANVTNTTFNPVSFSVSSSNPGVTATVLSGGRSLDLNVSGVDSSHVAFTGDIVMRLFENLAPDTTARIIHLAQSGFYNGLIFHRVISGFVAQGGDPTGTGSGGTGTPFNDEFNTQLTYTSNGLLGMANAGHNTNDSQFFITAINQTLAQLPQHLNFENPIFGIVTSGFDTLNKLLSTPVNPSSDRPLTNEVINSATVFTDPNNGVIELQSAAGLTGSTTITITASDGHGSTSQQQTTLNVVNDTVNDPPFLGAVSNQVATQGVPVTFTVQGIDLQNDPLTFVVKDLTSFQTEGGQAADPANVNVSIHVTGASGGNPSFATITLTPSVTFSGTINMTIGVRDSFLHAGAASLDSPRNFDWKNIILTVNPINHAPTTPGGSTRTNENQVASIQLTGNTGDPDKNQTLTFILVSQPAHGTISNFNAATGALTYTPNSNFAGNDSFTYKVQDNGGTANGGHDTSSVATFSIAVNAPVPPPVSPPASPSKVLVMLAGGDVILIGDSGSHDFGVAVAGSNLEFTGLSGTQFTYNGTTQTVLDISRSSVNGLLFEMPGSNTITIDGTRLGTLSGNVTALLGNGSNTFSLTNATIAGDVNVVGGRGGNSITLTGDTVRDASIFTGDGADSVTLTNVTLQSAPLVPSVPALSALTFGATLNINTGGGASDTIALSSVTGTSSLIGGWWNVSTGAVGKGTVTLNSISNPGATVVVGNVITAAASTFGAATVAVTGGSGQNLAVGTSTFNGPAVLVGAGGAAQTISVDHSTFKSAAVFVAGGDNSKIKVQTAAGGTGTVFQGPMVGVVTGASGTVMLGNSAAGGTLDFQGPVIFVGDPTTNDTTIDVATAVTTLDSNKLVLVYAKRVNV